MNDREYEEFGGPSERAFQGVSRGPGASLEKAIQQAARAAAGAGFAGVPLSIVFVEIEPQEHNQWVRTFTVTAVAGG